MNDFALKMLRGVTSAAAATDLRRQTSAGRAVADAHPAERSAEAQSEPKLEAAIEHINSYLEASRRELQYQLDEESGQVVVRVRNAATGEVVRQIPNEEALRLARALQENMPVLLDLVV